MENKLKTIEKEIRKKILRLLEDSAGCKYKDENFEYTLIGVDDISEVFILQYRDVDMSYKVKYVHSIYLDIIGHDILLSDVLDYIKRKEFLYNDFFNDILGLWDFSKKYLKDQSEELIDYLYNLKEK